MFGKKAARIKELEAQIAQRRSLEHYLPLAEDIASRIDSAASDTGTFLHVNIEAVLQAVEEEHRIKRFFKIFNTLPADKRLALLLQSPVVNGNAPLLQAALDKEMQNMQALANIDAVLEKSRGEGYIDVQTIPINALVRFFLYTSDDISERPKPKALIKNTASDVKFDARHEGAGVYSVVNMLTHDDEIKLLDGFTANNRYSLGTLMGDELDSTVYFGASLHFQNATGIHAINAKYDYDDTLNLKVGRIKVDKKDAFV